MKYYLSFIILIFTTVSCVKKDTKLASHKLSPEVKAAADSLSKMRGISQSGDLRFHNLLKVASAEDLVFLTNHKAPVLRCYAFYGLELKKYPEVKEIFYDHLKDTAVVHSVYGCIGSYRTVMEIMLAEFHPATKQNKFRFSRAEYDKFERIAEIYRKKMKYPVEPDWEARVKELQSSDLLYSQLYSSISSKCKDFEAMRKRVKNKNIEFKRYEDMVLATAYFEVNGCNLHFPNVERKGDTIILKDQLLEKYSCDEEHRIVEKISFVISDVQASKIKTVISE